MKSRENYHCMHVLKQSIYDVCYFSVTAGSGPLGERNNIFLFCTFPVIYIIQPCYHYLIFVRQYRIEI